MPKTEIDKFREAAERAATAIQDLKHEREEFMAEVRRLDTEIKEWQSAAKPFIPKGKPGPAGKARTVKKRRIGKPSKLFGDPAVWDAVKRRLESDGNGANGYYTIREIVFFLNTAMAGDTRLSKKVTYNDLNNHLHRSSCLIENGILVEHPNNKTTTRNKRFRVV